MAELHVEIDTRDDKPPLLLLHGFLSSNLQWLPNRDALQNAFRLIAVELWGHGGSPAPREPDAYRVDAYLSRFEALRERLGTGSWFVCGQSFGAGLMIRYALAHQSAVRGLVFTNSRSALNDATREPRTVSLANWQAMDMRSLPFHPCHAKRFPADLKADMEVAADAVEPYALWQAMRTTMKGLSCRRDAAGLAIPTLLVNGRWEKAFQSDRDFAVATIPDLEVVDLEAGHSVNIEASQKFNEALVGFAQRHGE